MVRRFLHLLSVLALACAAGALAAVPAAEAQSVQSLSYDVQADVADQTAEHIDLAISVRASAGSEPFHIAEQNYRLTYDDSQLDFWDQPQGGTQAPYIINQPGHLTGFVEQDGFGASFYSETTVTGSQANGDTGLGTISVNLELLGGPGMLISSDWLEVARIRIFIDDPSTIPASGLIDWIPTDAFPPTSVWGVIDGTPSRIQSGLFEVVGAALVDSPDVVPAVTCLAGNGRVDLNLLNTGDASAVYRMQIGALSPRQNTINPDGWWRSPVTGRPDGPIQATVTRNGEVIFDRTLTVACDDAPNVETPEIQIMSYCIGTRGMILTQFANPTDSRRSYIVDVRGIRRSTTAANFGAAVRGVSGRPNGEYPVEITTGGTVLTNETITVSC